MNEGRVRPLWLSSSNAGAVTLLPWGSLRDQGVEYTGGTLYLVENMRETTTSMETDGFFIEISNARAYWIQASVSVHIWEDAAALKLEKERCKEARDKGESLNVTVGTLNYLVICLTSAETVGTFIHLTFNSSQPYRPGWLCEEFFMDLSVIYNT